MNIITDKLLGDFIANSPLYKQIVIVQNFEKNYQSLTNPSDYEKKPFKFLCPIENEEHTFTTELPEGNHFFASLKTLTDKNESPQYFDKKTGFLNLSFHLRGRCQSCRSCIDFLLQLVSSKAWKPDEHDIDILLQKIGQYPVFQTKVEKDIAKYLNGDDLIFYRKGLANISVGYGVGAHAYFRRIIENEIVRLAKDISQLEFEGSDKVAEAFRNYESDHQMSTLISVLNRFLPSSLKELGDNPIRLLYEQLSEGIHSLSEDECLEKAQLIDTVLKFVIRRINEEKFQLKDVKLAMAKLRGSSA